MNWEIITDKSGIAALAESILSSDEDITRLVDKDVFILWQTYSFKVGLVYSDMIDGNYNIPDIAYAFRSLAIPTSEIKSYLVIFQISKNSPLTAEDASTYQDKILKNICNGKEMPCLFKFRYNNNLLPGELKIGILPGLDRTEGDGDEDMIPEPGFSHSSIEDIFPVITDLP